MTDHDISQPDPNDADDARNDKPLFPKYRAGRIVSTPGAIQTIAAAAVITKQNAVTISRTLLKRHLAGDWGECGAEDWATNDDAIAHEGDPDRQSRTLSAYTLIPGNADSKVWLITEWDRSATTILRPDEY